MAEIAYLMGRDAGGTNPFYAEARGYFTSRQIVVAEAAQNQTFTLQSVFADLDQRANATPAKVFDTVHIVTHSNAFGGVEFALDSASLAARGAFTGLDDLKNAQAAGATFKKYGGKAVSTATTIQIDGCDIGRDLEFLKLFGLLFGQPRRVLGSRRVVMFMQDGGKRLMVPCRTWSVVWKPAAFPETSAAKWVAFRSQFVDKAVLKFAPHATSALPDDEVQRLIKPVAENATHALSSTRGFFFTEETALSFSISPPPADDMTALRKYMRPAKSAVAAGTDLDDTTVPTVIAPSDFAPLQASNSTSAGVETRTISGTAVVVILAQSMKTAIDTSDRSLYSEVTIAPATAPSSGPKPTAPDGGAPAGGGGAGGGGGGGSGGAPKQSSVIDDARNEIVAAGGQAEALDALVAEASELTPENDATASAELPAEWQPPVLDEDQAALEIPRGGVA